MSADPDDAPAPPAAPSRLKGCLAALGVPVSMFVGFAGAVVAMGVFNAPFGVMIGILFGTPAVYVVTLAVLGVRHVKKYPTFKDRNAAEQAAAGRVVLPVIVAFVVVAALSIGGVIVALALDAPGWVIPIVFFTPSVLLTALAWPYLKGLGDRIKRATPSPERAAVLADTPVRATPVAPAADPADFPTVPPDPSTPGTRLPHRLAASGFPAGCACCGILAVTLFWNGIVAVFEWQVIQGFLNGKPEWFLVVFLIPFVIVGLLMVAALVFAALAWVVALLAGHIAVEVDDHPFVPGGRYRGSVAQAGLCRLTKVGVELACEEAATYQAGTTESTDKKVVFKQLAELPEPLPAAPVDFIVAVPADAMHSFAAAKNNITWTVTVWGRVLGVLPYSRSFQVVVRPAAGDV